MRLFVYLFVLAVLRNCFAIPIPSGHHSQSESLPYVCRHENCGRSFKRGVGRTRHENSHTNEIFVCSHENCGQPSTSKAGKTLHERAHLASNEFHCGEKGCGAIFTDLKDRKAHARIHSELWFPVVLNDNSPLHRKREKYREKKGDVSNMWCEVPS
jgi:uncharacterized Zn-finger protein